MHAFTVTGSLTYKAGNKASSFTCWTNIMPELLIQKSACCRSDSLNNSTPIVKQAKDIQKGKCCKK